MKRCLWAVSATLMVFCGWQIVACLAQDDNDTAATPPLESAAPALVETPTPESIAAPVAEPVETPEPDAVGAPLAPSAAKGPPPSAAKGPLAPLRGDVAAPAEPKVAEAKQAESKTEKFDIDRTPPSVSAASEAKDLIKAGAMEETTAAVPFAAPAEASKAESRGSFWSRLFGADKEKDKAPAAQPSESVGAPLAAPAVAAPVEPVAAPAEAAVAPAAQVEKKPETQEEILAAQEEVRRQAREIEGLKYLDLAYQAMSRNEFDQALKLFNQALSIMPVRPYTVETRNKARMAQAQCEYRLALKHYQQGNLEEAMLAAKAALGYVPNHKDAQRLSERIGRDRLRITTMPPPPIRFAQEHLDKEKRIKDAISRGQQYMAVHEYNKAVYEFKTVLSEDEGNEEANANLKKIAEEGYQLQTDQYERMAAEMMTQVRDTWTPPIKKEVRQPITRPDEVGVISPQKQRLLTKLNTIIIPQAEFREGNIVDVIRYLNQQAIIADKDSPAGEKGVNIILQLRRPGQAAPAAAGAAAPAVGEEDLFAAESLAGMPAASIPTVSMEVHNMVLIDLLKLITDNTGLKFRVESNVVIITPADVVVGEVITRTYRVQPNMGDLISGSLGAAAAAQVGVGVDLMATPTVAPIGNVKTFFVEAGVPFPEGTSIKYQQSLNLLIVANTSENLEKFESILAKLNVIPIQVEIEARFVEIGQTDLEELGIEWLLTDNWEIAMDAGAGAAVPLSARERLQINKNIFTKGLRNLDSASGSASPGGAMAGIFSMSSILTNPELSFILHALEQRDSANLLSAPKVTTKSGANAEIKVVREIIYPTEFESSAQTAGGTQVGQTAVVITPTGFQTRDTGVILNVTPVVGPDGFTIDLTMMPQVVELGGWINYGSTVLDPGGVPRQVNMPQPVFYSRSIQTSISIWDGQTVVMGGLITEQQSMTVDKIPFLGDIPLIGYLFQSKTSRSEKRNLLIFVTANLVDPAGNKINPTPMGMAGTVSISSGAGAGKATP